MQKPSKLTRAVRLRYTAPNKRTMNIKELFDEWKTVIGFITTIVVATVGVIAYAEDAKEQAIVMMQAQASLIHDDFYQNGRIARKEDQIIENTRELNNILEDIGDDEPTIRQQRNLDYLDTEILRLRLEIESIRVELAKVNE